ncbi:MAG TPA: VanZ family protein [Treponemataceae bacterium]|nr:VanZ family protein [Treponemataceae bacterium]
MTISVKKVLVRIPAILVTLTSWYLSSQSSLPKSISIFTYDKLIHFLSFAFLAFCWSLWFTPKQWKEKPLRGILYVLIIVGIYGAIDEYHQSFTPGRDMSLFDWFADMIGALFGSLCAWVSLRLYYNYKLKQL